MLGVTGLGIVHQRDLHAVLAAKFALIKAACLSAIARNRMKNWEVYAANLSKANGSPHRLG